MNNNTRTKEILQANEQLRNSNIQKDREIQSLTNDLNIVTQQNKSFSQEIERLSNLGLQMKMNINGLKDEGRASNEKERHKEMQLRDIMDAYRKCAEENEILKKKVENVKNTETTLYENLRNVEKELSMAQAEKDALVNKQSLNMEEIGTLEQHVENLNRELEISQAQIGNLHSTNSRIIHDQRNVQNVASTLENSNNDIIKKLSAQEIQSVSVKHPYLKN